MAGDKVCIWCKAKFEPTRPWSKLCSSACQKRWKSKEALKRYHKVKSQMSENIEWRMNKICKMAEARAKAQDLPFDITSEYLVTLYEAQHGECDVSGRKFNLSPSESRPHPDSPSLDKIIPAYGYTEGNVRLTTYHVNVCLADYGMDAFLELCEDVMEVN